MGLLSSFQYCFLDDRGRGRRLLRDHPVLAEDVIPERDIVSICYVERSVKDWYHSVSAFGSSTGTFTGTSIVERGKEEVRSNQCQLLGIFVGI